MPKITRPGMNSIPDVFSASRPNGKSKMARSVASRRMLLFSATCTCGAKFC